MNDEYRELFVMYGNEDEHTKLILELKEPDDTRGAYVDNPYPERREKVWNVDKCKDIPWEYDGYIGVPISFLYKINRDVFEIIDTNGGWRNTYRVNGELIYFRYIIKRKKDCPLYEWYDEENKIKYVGTSEDLILMFENENRPKPKYKLTEEDNIPFDEFIKKYTATDEAKLKALRENFKFWKLRNEYEKIKGIKILIL